MTFGWKLLLALLPPSSLIGRPVTFVIGLLFQLLLSILLRDIGLVLSCACKIPEAVMALIIVAIVHIVDFASIRWVSLPLSTFKNAFAVLQKVVKTSWSLLDTFPDYLSSRSYLVLLSRQLSITCFVRSLLYKSWTLSLCFL